HREAFIRWVHRWPFGHRPRFERAACFEPEIEMQARCTMHLHDETCGLRFAWTPLRRRRFGGLAKISLRAIRAQERLLGRLRGAHRRLLRKDRPLTTGSSRTHSSGRLSVRKPRYTGWRRMPSRVHSPNLISATSFV